MRKFMLWSHNHPILVTFIILTVNIIAMYFVVTGFKVDASASGMMIQGDPDKDYYEETLEKFGTDNISIIYVKDKDLFSPEKLAMVDELAYQLEELEGVSKVESLFTVTNFKGEDGALSTNPLIDYLPETSEEALAIKQDALRNPILVNNLIAKDGSATAINLFVDGDPDDPEYNAKFSRKVDEIIAQFYDEKKGIQKFEKVFQLGNSYTKRMITESILNDQNQLVPFSVLVLMLTLIITMRSINGAILPIITAGSSVIWSAGFMFFVGIPLNILTVIVPSLIIVIGSTEDIHLLSEYMEGLEHTNFRDKAIHYMASKCGTAIMLTAITTFLGFLSITLNQITILKQFGIVASFGLFVNPLITGMAAPVYLKYFGAKTVKHVDSDKKGVIQTGIDYLADLIIASIRKYKWRILTFLLGGAVFIGAFTVQVKVDNDLLGFFKPSSDIRTRSQTLHEEICGAQPFYIRISSGIPNTFKDPKYLKQVEALQKFMLEQGWFDKTFSLSDYISLIHREMNDGKQEFLKVPSTPGLIPQYLLTLQRSEIERFVTTDYSEVNILVRHNISSSHELKEALVSLNSFLKVSINEHFTFGFTGENILVNKAADSMATGQAQSLSLLLIIIFIIMSMLFVNVKAGALSLIPNFFPIVVIFGIMGIFDIPLNTGTAMVAAISIGIAVDDTVHFMTRYNKEMRELQDQDKAMEVCIRSEITPVLSTSIALALGFAVVTASSFVPVIYFGFLSALVMLFALLGDMFITPILLSSTQLITILDMIKLNLDDKVIQESRLFQKMRPWQIKKIILIGKVLEKEAKQYAISYGDEGTSMYLLLEGQAQVLATDPRSGKQTTVATLEPGDVFGEIALVNPGPRSADICATEHIKYLELDWAGMMRIKKIFPRIASQMFLNLSNIMGERLVHTDQLLLDALSKK